MDLFILTTSLEKFFRMSKLGFHCRSEEARKRSSLQLGQNAFITGNDVIYELLLLLLFFFSG